MGSIRLERFEGPPAGSRSLEIVERKGLGHPDTICDMVSERLSVALSRRYLERFGHILHHNVDKALLTAGQAIAAFGGGEVIEPIDLYVSGRATIDFGGEHVGVGELVQEVVTGFFHNHFHALDPGRHVRVHCLVRPGSRELADIMLRQPEHGVLLCNDTSCGVGFAPLTELEKTVLAVERRLNSPDVKLEFPACGQDVKIMGIRDHENITLTIACALIGRFLPNLEAYAEAKQQVAGIAKGAAHTVTDKPVDVLVNAADEPKRGAIYLTVTGTSAESGDDGETGRGNRPNGLITPARPMTIEAAAGKNPLTHTGKLYSAAAQRIAENIIGSVAEIKAAECFLVSQIGAPIGRPQAVIVRVDTVGHVSLETERRVNEIVADQLAGISRLWERFLSGELFVC